MRPAPALVPLLLGVALAAPPTSAQPAPAPAEEDSHYAHLLGETDDGSEGSVRKLTWAPAHTAKAGVSYSLRRFTLALLGRYQSTVLRRPGDFATPAFREARPESVPAWIRFDVNTRLQLNAWSSVGLSVTNLLDTENDLVRTGDLPFDYRMEGRRILGNFELTL